MRDFFKDRRYLYAAAVLAVFIVVWAVGMNRLLTAKKELQQVKAQRSEMTVLYGEYVSLKQKIDAVESRKNLASVQGIVQAVDEVFSPIGMRDKVRTVKATGKRESKDGFEEEADVQIEKITMNEMVNIFYKIEHAPVVLTIKKVTIKKSFENPELLNVALSLSFLKAK